MLQLFVDESVSNHPPIYAMSGVLSTAENWAKLSDEWQAVLDMPLRLEYFKMSEAMACGGEFLGFSETRRNERLQMLVNILTKYSIAILSCFLPHDVYKSLLTHPGVPKHLQNPYCFLFYGMLFRIPKFRETFKLDGKIDVVFDEQLGAKDQLLKGYEQIKERLPLVGAPTFRNDRHVLPLQAADLVAWTVRRDWENIYVWPNVTPKPPWNPPFTWQKTVPNLQFPWDQRSLHQFLGEVLGQTGRGSYTMTLTYADGRTETVRGGHDSADKGG